MRKRVEMRFALLLLLLTFVGAGCGGNREPSRSGTIGGNPRVPVTHQILFAVCGVINRCNPEVTLDRCQEGVLHTSGFDARLGLPPGYSTLSSILQAEQSGALTGNSAATSDCYVNINTLACSDTTVQAAYDATQSNPFAQSSQMVPTSSCSQVFTPGINLEVPVELLDTGVASRTTSTVFARSRISLDTAAYDGTVTYSFEVIAENLDSSSRSVDLVNSAGSAVASLSIPAATTPATRIRASFVPTAGQDNYRISLSGTSSADELKVYTARILVKQVGATQTRIYVPLTSNWTDSSSNSDDPTATNAYSNYATYGSGNTDVFSVWKKNNSAFSQIAADQPWTLEVVLGTSVAGSSRAYVSLFSHSSGAQVPASELSTTVSTPTLLSASFSEGAAGFVDGEDFLVKIRNDGGNTSLYRAGLWLKLANLAHAEVYYRYHRLRWHDVSVPATAHSESRILLDRTLFMSPTFYHEVTSLSNSALATCTITLQDGAASDSGTVGTAVTGSAITISGLAPARKRSSPLLINSGNRFFSSVAPVSGSGSCTPNNGFVVVGF
jgi:hypothetical protein